MRVVLDTNILARAHHRATGPAREVLTIVRSEPHCLIVSPFLLRELLRVLNYPRLRSIHQLTQQQIDAFVSAVEQIAAVVYPPTLGEEPKVASDPDDDAIIQTAVVGKADVLCTRDRHLRHETVRAYCQQRGIEVMDEIALLESLRQGDDEV